MKYSAVIGLTLSVISFSVFAHTEETKKVQVVDTQGKPPFKRKLVEVPVKDVAQFEEASEVETIKKRVVVSYQGKPPYTRRTIEVPVGDVAQFEDVEGAGQEKTKKGSRPPYDR